MAGWREELHPRDPADGQFVDTAGWVHRLSAQIGQERGDTTKMAVRDYAWGVEPGGGNRLVGGLQTGLRAGATLAPHHQGLRERLQQAFRDAAPLDKPLKVHRVVSGNPSLYYALIGSAKTRNGTWTEPGLMSTSRRADTAADFDLGGNTVEMALTVPAGARVLDVDKILGADSEYPQQEVLLPEGTTIRWTREPVGVPGTTRVRLVGTVVPPGAK